MNRRFSPFRFILIILIFFSFSISLNIMPTLASDAALKTAEEAVQILDNDEFERAVGLLSAIISDDFIINDFALLWRAESYSKMGNLNNALSDIEIIKKKYGDTAAFRNALRLELEISKQYYTDRSDIFTLYEYYLAIYPVDWETQFEYARILRDNGRNSDAVEVYKKLYIKANAFSEKAAKEFDTSILTLEELIERGDNLLKKWDFIKAETEFQKALIIVPKSMMENIKEKIAYCKFRQKNYKEAAQLYSKLNDRYMEAVAYLRIGERESFVKTIDKLITMKDPRTGVLLIALANEKRRSGAYYDAILTLNETFNSSPFKEDTLWQIGWTQYQIGNFSEAEMIFNELYDTYRSNKYIYWMLRSRGKMSLDVSEGYRKLCSENNYYGFLSCMKTGMNIRKVSPSIDDVSGDSPLLKRFSILKRLGYKDEALYELNRLIKSLKKPGEIILYSRKLKEIGEYKKAISFATMVPYNDTVHELVYPVAYWEIIQGVSRKFSLDPAYILSIAREESRLDPEARSIAGALGLMQLMPSTADRICRKIKCTIPDKDAFYDIETNITLGSYYLKTLLDRFKSIPVATAAYNAGENTVERWLKIYKNRTSDEFIEDIPYPETRKYVKKVLTTLYQYSKSLDRTNNYGILFKKVSLSFD